MNEPKTHRIVELIPTGAENAISMRRLAALEGISQRRIRLEINRERLENGVPIIGNDAGYYLPETDDDLNRYLQRKYGQYETCGAVIDCIENYLSRRRKE